jgi:positive regulator of sigma E activity
MTTGDAWIVGMLALVLVGFLMLSSQLKEIAQETRSARLILQRLLDRDVDRAP